jgi:four helix bundle protein
MAAARRVEELDCWQLGDELKRGAFVIADGPRARRNRRFCEQICEAASSVTRNIGEGFGRKSDPEFVRYLSIARGSLNECQDELKDARTRGYVDTGEFRRLLVLSGELAEPSPHCNGICASRFETANEVETETAVIENAVDADVRRPLFRLGASRPSDPRTFGPSDLRTFGPTRDTLPQCRVTTFSSRAIARSGSRR